MPPAARRDLIEETEDYHVIFRRSEVPPTLGTASSSTAAPPAAQEASAAPDSPAGSEVSALEEPAFTHLTGDEE